MFRQPGDTLSHLPPAGGADRRSPSRSAERSGKAVSSGLFVRELTEIMTLD